MPTDFEGATSCSESTRPGSANTPRSAVFLRTPLQLLALALLASCRTPATAEPQFAPPSPSGARTTGSELVQRIAPLPLASREQVLWAEFENGNVPLFLAHLVPVTTTAMVDGRQRTARFWVAPDWFGFGTDADWCRMPMTPQLAQRIADHLDCTLPTRCMSDAVWRAASVKLRPQPISPKEHDICSVEQFHRHHAMVEAQLQGADRKLLVAGAKKDVVSSALVAVHPGRVVICGWHHPDGKPIQPLSKVHGFGHVDYSHGIRLVARRMEVDGVPTTVDAVLADTALHVLLSDEGPIVQSRYPTR